MKKNNIFRIIVCLMLVIMFVLVVRQYIGRNKQNKQKFVVSEEIEIQQNKSETGTITVIGKDPNTQEVVVLSQYKGTIKHNDTGKNEQNIILFVGE